MGCQANNLISCICTHSIHLIGYFRLISFSFSRKTNPVNEWLLLFLLRCCEQPKRTNYLLRIRNELKHVDFLFSSFIYVKGKKKKTEQNGIC